ncbi:MAG: ionic transporter y4hA [Rhodomicrobium sp.]
MTPKNRSADQFPFWTWGVPVAASVLLAAEAGGLIPPTSSAVRIAAGFVLAATVFASVYHAEIIALRVGEPFGSIVLAVAVTIIEVASILSIMLAAKEAGGAVARDTVFATVMLVLNGITGLCLVLGGARHHEQSFQTNAAAAALSVLGTLAVITLVLPNYAIALPGPYYSRSQLLFIGIVSIVLYGVFLFVQTVRHQDYFLNLSEYPDGASDAVHDAAVLSNKMALVSLALLGLALGAVILLAKVLSPALEEAVASAQLPKAFTGVVIAAMVLLPEGTAAVRAAHRNRLQTSLNLALGSALATIGLTIPAVGLLSIITGQPLTLGLDMQQTVLLLLTLFISTVTLATGRTTILQGSVHLVIFAVFMFFAIVP